MNKDVKQQVTLREAMSGGNCNRWGWEKSDFRQSLPEEVRADFVSHYSPNNIS